MFSYCDGILPKTKIKIDYESGVSFSEKIDGTLICLFNYENQWMISSRQSPVANDISFNTFHKNKPYYYPRNPSFLFLFLFIFFNFFLVYNAWRYFDEKLQYDPKSFSTGEINEDDYHPNQPFTDERVECVYLDKLFWKCWNENNFDFPLDKNLCYLFEFQSEKFEFIIAKSSYYNPNGSIVCHGIRDMQNYSFIEIEVFLFIFLIFFINFLKTNRKFQLKIIGIIVKNLELFIVKKK